jgi:hypothetical protein
MIFARGHSIKYVENVIFIAKAISPISLKSDLQGP